tara:strand:- start:16 stop:342 length:327 start_codon:yes stop_codon:yes gene_type:complete
MMPGLDPKKMQAAMKQMGIKQEEIDADRVIIERSDERIVIDNPGVTKIEMQGQESWQITGDASTEAKSGIDEEDVKLVMEKTGKSEGEVRGCLERNGGDIAKSIMDLS